MKEKQQSLHVRQKRAKRIEAILDVAMSILGAEGIEGVTVHRLARELGLTVGALYRYFDSKEDLITSLWSRTLGGFQQELAYAREYCLANRAKPLSASDSIAVLVVIAQEYVWQCRSRPSRFYFMMQALTRETVLLPEEVRPKLMKRLFELLDVIESSIGAASKVGGLRAGNERERTMAMWATLNGAMSLNKLGRTDPNDAPTGHLVEQMLMSLFSAWGADAETLLLGWKRGMKWHKRIKDDGR